MKQIFIRGKKSSGVSMNVYNNISSSASTLDIILDSQDNFYYENDAVEAVDKNLEIQQESSQIKTNSTPTTLTGFQNFTDFMINNTEEHNASQSIMEEPHHQEEIFESSPTLGQGIK